ncbi:MAG: class I SAM-dependent methyltransferase, partial [Candidatus Omnitrophica bacterium]|nr:class I SAM-dependent methyltransferase [Candidatus Omnitrophota bacterium]
EHRAYLHSQLSRTLQKKEVYTGSRYRYLIEQLQKRIDLSELTVLCIGCRSIEEINDFKALKTRKVVGIDLFSEDREIMVMDMHNMSFDDNSFDIIFSCHSLEHARNYKKVISEFIRVAKNGSMFVIEVPVQYGARGTDLWDFESLENVRNMFQPYVGKILFEEYARKNTGNNFSGTDIARIIFKIIKEA